MTNIRRRIIDAIKSAWDIKSPSRAFAEGMRQVAWDRAVFDGAPWSPPQPAPWYSARGPHDAYESPELRAAARRVRRLIRRHWFELMFEPGSPIAASVRAAMKAPPISKPEPDIYQQMRDLLDARTIEIASPTALDWYTTGITRP